MCSLDLCPFCNGVASIKGLGLGAPSFWAECNHCGAMGPDATTEEEAVAKWNDRAPQPEVTSHAAGEWDPLIYGGTPPSHAREDVSLSASQQAKPPMQGLTCESGSKPSITHPDEE